MRIERNIKLADVIHHDFNLIPVIHRFGIQLGFGDQTIEEICQHKEINIEFFLTILNAFHDPQYFPKKQLQSFPASMLVDYLRKAHQYYLNDKIPEIESLINQMTENEQMNKETYLLMKNFFNEYEKEFSSHTDREEKQVYPYIIALEKAIQTASVDEALLSRMNAYSINDYESEHDNVEDKLFDLKNIIIKYLPISKNDKLSFQILRELFALEKDLNEHARIEDMILVPKVEAMELTLKNMKH